ncbi:MAG: pyridoxamine 5'-phosphate oxidase family protein [Pseudomonadota bacterium]
MGLASNPFHDGERQAQLRAGAPEVASWAAGFIRGYMPQQHRDFYKSLPFLVVSASDDQERIWTTIVEGSDGFIRSPDRGTLILETDVDPSDPLAATLNSGSNVGVLGIELATRRRNRLSGMIRPTAGGFAIDIRQTFGNCPQYIREREWHRVDSLRSKSAKTSDHLTSDQIALIRHADTLFIGSGYQAGDGQDSNGFDASHRGGEPGFVQIIDGTHLRIPDYAGNNFFNTIGNLLRNPHVGLLFVDFETGGMVQISGLATIDWDPHDVGDAGARRMIDVTVKAVVDRPAALSLRWEADVSQAHELVVARKEVEAKDIASFYLSPAGGAPLPVFEAGQHLPIELDIPGQPGKVRRSYSLSGSPKEDTYRLSIKREDRGLVSRFMHDVVGAGSPIRARRPSGEFVVPCNQCPLVLASAGVGLTPMVSMLHAVAVECGKRPVWFVHGARDSSHHALRDEVDRIVGDRPNISNHILYSRPGASDRIGTDYHKRGRVDAQTLLDLNTGPDTHYMLCGPAQFLADVRSGLEDAEVPVDQIHFETFGPVA